MGKLASKDTLWVKPDSLYIQPVAGWSWYCGHHDTFGIGDDEDEVLFMAGAHMHYHQIDGDVCQIYTKIHTDRREQ